MKKKQFKIILIASVVVLLVIAYYGFFRSDDTTVTIRDHVFQTEIADSAKELKNGLSNRESLDNNQAMLFLFDRKSRKVFWMKDMNFNIDLLWIADDKVTGYEKNMIAPAAGTSDKDLLKYYSEEPVDKVLEMNAGLIDSIGIEIGDQIIIN